MHNLYKRGLIFATFLGCSVSVAFLAASMSTDRWAEAYLKRSTNPLDSDGRVSLGLFNGKRELNVGYGWRTYSLSVTERIDTEPKFLNFGLWLATVSCVSAAIAFSVIGALMAIVNTASTPVEAIAGRTGLIVWNSTSMGCAAVAIICWVVQFYTHLVDDNILVPEDRDNNWSTNRRTYLGYSFWFVIGSIFSHVANIVLLFLVNAEERKKHVKPLPREKTMGAVLLY